MAASATLVLSLSMRSEWTGAAANNLVDDPANWAGGVIDGVFTPTLTANLTLQATADVEFTSGLSFLSASDFSLIIEPSTVTTRTFTLGGDINVDISGNTTSKVVRLGASTGSRPIVLDLDGGTRTITVNAALAATAGTGRDTLTLWGDVTNGSLIKTGGGSLEFNSALSLSGSYVNEGGYTLLQNSASMLSVGKVVVGGSAGRFVLKGSVNDRLSDTADVHLAGGIFGYQNVGGTSTENIGTVYLQGARSAIGLTSGTLHLAELVRDPYSTVALVGSSTARFGAGSTKFTVGSDANILSSLTGGDGTEGTTTVSILPWATATTAISNSFTDSFDSRYYSADFGFVTYTSDGGFRVLDKTTEYVSSVTGSSNATDNVRLTADETLAGTKTINSLFMDKGSNHTLNLGGQTLNVTSGAVAAANNQITISNGTLNFGSKTGYIMLGRNSSSAISANLAGSGGVVFAMTPDQPLTISGANTYTGRTVVNSGTLALGANNTLPTGTDVRIDKTGTLRVNNGFSQLVRSLSGSGVVQLSNTASRLDVGTSVANSSAGVFTVGTGGSVSVGDDAGYYQVSQLTFTGGSVSFEAGSVLDIDIASALSFDSINLATAGKTVTVAGGTLSLSFLDGYAPTVGDSFQLFSIAGVAVANSVVNAGNFTIVGPADYTFSLDNTGLLTVVSAVPEPSTYAALFAGMVLTVAVVRRRRG
ncbi:MAG: PEP-CTERM sorting domain-containing protein [Opitutaceae bacterium]|jgi:autotransporter-associated beta strand protein